MGKGNHQRRFRNNPPIRILIEGFLTKRKEASFKEIYEYIEKQNIRLVSKTPQRSVYSIMHRMNNLERVGLGKYRLKSVKDLD